MTNTSHTYTAQLGMAGWGCPDPNNPGGDFLSDGHDSPEDATAAAKLYDELLERADQMSDTEFRVKAQRLRHLGGYWPQSLADWTTPEGMGVSAQIKTRRS